MPFPNFLLFRLLRSAALAWLMVRIAGAFLGVGLFSLPETILVSLTVLAICWLDIKIFRERLLFENLGVSPIRVSWIFLSSSLALDLSVALILDVIRRQTLGG